MGEEEPHEEYGTAGGGANGLPRGRVCKRRSASDLKAVSRSHCIRQLRLTMRPRGGSCARQKPRGHSRLRGGRPEWS